MTSLMSEAQKAAEEWRNAAEKAELKSDPFPVVGWAASRNLTTIPSGSQMSARQSILLDSLGETEKDQKEKKRPTNVQAHYGVLECQRLSDWLQDITIAILEYTPNNYLLLASVLSPRPMRPRLLRQARAIALSNSGLSLRR